MSPTLSSGSGVGVVTARVFYPCLVHSVVSQPSCTAVVNKGIIQIPPWANTDTSSIGSLIAAYIEYCVPEIKTIILQLAYQSSITTVVRRDTRSQTWRVSEPWLVSWPPIGVPVHWGRLKTIKEPFHCGWRKVRLCSKNSWIIAED